MPGNFQSLERDLHSLLERHWPESGQVSHNQNWNEAELKKRLLCHEAERWLGICERGGNNQGQVIEMFQRAVDNRSSGEPWCMAFVQYCIKSVDALYSTCFSESGCAESPIYKSEHVLTTYNNSRKWAIDKPEPGAIVCWQMHKDGRGTSSGHTGIVVKVLSDDKILCIEGNTKGQGAEVNRDGDGVCQKERSLSGSGSMKVKGFLRPW